MEVLRCDQEKVEGRLLYLERQLSKAKFEGNCKEVKRKTFGKDNKRIERLAEETESMKNINKNIEHVYDPTQSIIKSKNDAEESKIVETRVLGHSESLSTAIRMNYSDDRDDISRPISSNESHHSSTDIIGFTISYYFF